MRCIRMWLLGLCTDVCHNEEKWKSRKCHCNGQLMSSPKRLLKILWERLQVVLWLQAIWHYQTKRGTRLLPVLKKNCKFDSSRTTSTGPFEGSMMNVSCMIDSTITVPYYSEQVCFLVYKYKCKMTDTAYFLFPVQFKHSFIASSQCHLLHLHIPVDDILLTWR